MTVKKPRRQRLLYALDLVALHKRLGTEAAIVIRKLVEEHGASFRPGASTNVLRVAGTAASCTWSTGWGLLDAWAQLANRHFLVLDGRADPARKHAA